MADSSSGMAPQDAAHARNQLVVLGTVAFIAVLGVSGAFACILTHTTIPDQVWSTAVAGPVGVLAGMLVNTRPGAGQTTVVDYGTVPADPPPPASSAPAAAPAVVAPVTVVGPPQPVGDAGPPPAALPPPDWATSPLVDNGDPSADGSAPADPPQAAPEPAPEQGEVTQPMQVRNAGEPAVVAISPRRRQPSPRP